MDRSIKQFDKPQMNANGIYINCNFHSSMLHAGKGKCVILKNWYNDNKNCNGCKFFKTKEQYEYEESLYPRVK